MNFDFSKLFAKVFSKEKSTAESAAAEQSSIRVKLAVLMAAAAVALIVFSDISQCAECGTKKTTEGYEELTAEQYAVQLENKLEGIVEGIVGTGDVRVMVTLESGVEYIYASEDSSKTDQSQRTDSDGRLDTDSLQDVKSSYKTLDGENGEEALIRTTVMPRIGGVVVLCPGGENAETAELVKEAVSTALGISSRKVFVTRMRS